MGGMSINAGSRPSRASSLRQERRDWAAELRAQGSTWVEIADAFADRYGVNPRVSFRLAHDWSQRDAAEQWNHHWPDDPKTFKNFSYWEQAYGIYWSTPETQWTESHPLYQTFTQTFQPAM